MKKALLVALVASVLTISLLVVAGVKTAASSSPATTTKALQSNIVHLNNSLFVPDSITIRKGQTITIVDDVEVEHVVANGTWQSNGNAKYQVESGAPKIVMQFQGNDSHRVGPFNTAGTFHLYCTVHQGMNLTVIVS